MNTVPQAERTMRRAPPAAPEGDLVLGRFRMLEPLGSGGHGTVWVARDERLRRNVAVKRIARAHDADHEDRRRIGREALAAARLSHPAIVAFHEALSDDHAYYLVSELVRGSSLAELYADSRLGDRDLIRIGVALSDALMHAHSRGVVHRDVKPQNVIVPDDSDEGGAPAKLTDFGVAHIADEQPLTQAGDVIGTFAYMAPEQADGATASPDSDLYSLALTLYEGFVGRNPHRGTSAAATARRIGATVPSLALVRADLPVAVSAAIDRALRVDPRARGTFSDLRSALSASLRGRGASRRALRGTPQRGSLTARGERVAAATAAAALTAAALATVLGPQARLTDVCAGATALILVTIAPRAGWLALAFGAVAWLALSGQPGTAVLLAIALAPVPALLAAEPWLWSVPALGPALGALGLAAAFPAIAARAGGDRGWRRAALGALGYWWVALTEALTGKHFLFGLAPGARPRAGWEASVPGVIDHAVVPLCSPGRLAPAALWAVAAIVLPWLLRGGTLALRAAAALAWAGALIAASVALGRHLGTSGPPLPLAAAFVAGLVAVSVRQHRFRVPTRANVA